MSTYQKTTFSYYKIAFTGWTVFHRAEVNTHGVRCWTYMIVDPIMNVAIELQLTEAEKLILESLQCRNFYEESRAFLAYLATAYFDTGILPEDPNDCEMRELLKCVIAQARPNWPEPVPATNNAPCPNCRV